MVIVDYTKKIVKHEAFSKLQDLQPKIQHGVKIPTPH